MSAYYIVFVFLFFLSVIDFEARGNLKSKFRVGLGACCFIIFSGLRWETGTDWDSYLINFNSIHLAELWQSGYEIGFELLTRSVRFFSDDYTVMLIITAVIINCLTGLAFTAVSPYPIVSYLILFGYSFNQTGFGYRQDIAAAISLLSVVFIIRKQLVAFLIAITVAVCFHQSAACFFPAYWIAFIQWERRAGRNLLIIVSVLYITTQNLSFIASLLTSSASEKLGFYLEMTSEELMFDRGSPTAYIIQGGLNRVVLLFFPVMLLRQGGASEALRVLFNLQLTGCLLFIFLASGGPILTRFCRYFDLVSTLSLPICLLLFVGQSKRRLAFSFIAVLCVFKVSFFLFNDKGVFVPYRSIL